MRSEQLQCVVEVNGEAEETLCQAREMEDKGSGSREQPVQGGHELIHLVRGERGAAAECAGNGRGAQGREQRR